MRTETEKTIKVQHSIANIQIKPHSNVSTITIKRLICLALDSYAESESIPANVVHEEAKMRNKEYYQSPGYYLKIFRLKKLVLHVINKYSLSSTNFFHIANKISV